MFSLKAAFIALPLLAHSAIAAACNRQYTIVPGDTCDSISAAHNVSSYQLQTINAGVIDDDCGNLQPGYKLCLGYAGEDCTTTYVVKKDDTCELITNAHSINSTILYLNNPQIDEPDCTNIYIGEVLCVSKTVQVPPSNGPVRAPATAVAAASHATPTPVKAVADTPVDNKAPVDDKAPEDKDDQEYEDDEDLPWCEDDE